MGGLGKTRLSLQVAAETMHAYPDGAWFVDLSPIRDPALVVSETARALDVPEEPGRPLIETLCAYVKTRRLMLIFDNCEHLIDPAGDMVYELLKASPEIRIMASSREPLDVPGEQSYPIQPLPLPNRGDGAASLMRSTAARLFIDRVLAHRPDFELEDEEAADVADLVVRLEGIPLAIELAAARMRTLSVAQINDGLSHRFEVLTGGSRRLQARQQTLRALVDWSYDMLDAVEQRVLERLGVFVGGFDLAAAQAVCGVEPVDADALPALLGSLCDKSLAMRNDNADGARWRMLETIRDYAHDKLDDPRRAGRGGGAPLRALLRPGQGRQPRPGRARAAAVAAPLRDRGRQPARRHGAGAWPAGWTRSSRSSWRWPRWASGRMTGQATEGRAVVRAALALPEVQASDVAHAWGLYAGASLAGHQGDHVQARKMLESCLALRRRLDDPVQVAATLSTLSLTRLHTGDPAAAAEGEREALQLFRDEGDRIGEAIGLLHLGQIALYEGDVPRAREEFEHALAVSREVGFHEVEGESELMLGEAAFTEGDLERAGSHVNTSLTVCRDAADRNGEANALRWLGKVELARGDLAVARQHLNEALRAFETHEMREELVNCLEDHAELVHAEGDSEAAAALAAAVEQARSRSALPRAPGVEKRWQALLDALRAAVAEDRFDAAWVRGRRQETDEAVRAALAIRRR